MRILKTTSLNAAQHAQLDRLWDREYPVSLAGRYGMLLDGVSQYEHHLLLDESGAVAGWAVAFFKDDETRFSIIVDSAAQGRGYGAALIDSLKAGGDEFYGWVIDHDRDLRADGAPYRTPLPFYLKNGFQVLADQRIETPIISAVKVRWPRREGALSRTNTDHVSMNTLPDYKEINRQLWNKRTEVHLDSAFYDLPAFLTGASSLNDIELGLLGDIRGMRVLHLQCHFGQDSISLARLGASVIGVDLSDAAVRAAEDLAARTGADARFVCSDIYELPARLDEEFDIVFTSYGTIGWLPDLDKWAAVVSRFLKPGGRFVFVDFHPVVWMFDETFSRVAYRYFNSGPIIEMESGSYADRDADIRQQSVGWNHGISEVVNSLIRQGLTIRSLDEHDYSPYNIFREGVEIAPGRFRVGGLDDKIPLVYAIVADCNSKSSE